MVSIGAFKDILIENIENLEELVPEGGETVRFPDGDQVLYIPELGLLNVRYGT